MDLQKLSHPSVCAFYLQCKVMYQGWDSPELNYTINGIFLDAVHRFTYPDGRLSNDGNIGLEINIGISKA